MRIATVHALFLGALILAACSLGELRVTTIQLGRSLNADNSVGRHTTQFKPDDTMYVSVLTAGRGAGTIAARWSYAGRVVSEQEKRVSYYGDAATEFHIQNSGGFPAGQYRVEVLVDGQLVAARDFRVEW